MKKIISYYTKKVSPLTKRFGLVIVLFFLIINSILLYDNAQNKTPILGLRFTGQDISFFSQESLQKLVAKKAAEQNNPILFSYKGTIYPVTHTDIGYALDPNYSANTLLSTGRKGSLIHKLVVQIASLFGLENLSLSGSANKTSLTLKILELQQSINQSPIPIHPDFTHSMATTISAQPGVQLDSNKLLSTILLEMNYPQSTPLPLPVLTVLPQVHEENELVAIRQQAVKLTTSPISITSAGQTFTLTPQDLLQLLTVVERPDPKDSKKTKLVVRLDSTLLSQRLDTFAAKVEALTHTEFNYEDALAVLYGQFYFNNHTLTVIPTGNIPTNPHVLGAQTSTQKIAYITFDDGPNTIYHPLILDILRKYHVKATFFLIGQNIPAAHDAAIQTITDGHLVGNHTLTHSFLPSYSSPFILNEMSQANAILKSINGNQAVKFFRPPYGGTNSYVLQDAHALGLQVFLWDVDPRDWAEPPTDVLVHRVVDYVHNGSDVLLHSNHQATVRALPIILQKLIAEGYTFETLDNYPLPEKL